MTDYRQLLNQIILKLQPPVDGKKAKLSDTKAQFSEICTQIYEAARCCGTPFVSMHGDVFVYAQNHWVAVDSFDLKVFLKACCERISANQVYSSQYNVVDGLFKQFPYTCLIPNVRQAVGKINFLNGELDITGEKPTLANHTYSSYFRYVLPYSFDKNAKAPMFHKYLDRVVPDKPTQDVLAEYIFWGFIPSLKLEKIAFLYGSGCNGKSVFTDITEALVGSENVSHESLSDMCGESGDRSRSNLAGKIFNICSDVSPNACNGDIFKRLASNEPVSSKLLYKDATIIKDYAKMLFCLNELPRTNDLSNGYFRRFLIIPFNVQIPLNEIDPMLAKKIIGSELPGIMNWVLEGRMRLITNGGFTQSKLCDKMIDEYKEKVTGKKKAPLLLLPPYYDNKW